MESKGQSTELKGLSTGLKGLSRKFQQIHWGVPFPYPCMCSKKKIFLYQTDWIQKYLGSFSNMHFEYKKN